MRSFSKQRGIPLARGTLSRNEARSFRKKHKNYNLDLGPSPLITYSEFSVLNQSVRGVVSSKNTTRVILSSYKYARFLELLLSTVQDSATRPSHLK